MQQAFFGTCAHTLTPQEEVPENPDTLLAVTSCKAVYPKAVKGHTYECTLWVKIIALSTNF